LYVLDPRIALAMLKIARSAVHLEAFTCFLVFNYSPKTKSAREWMTRDNLDIHLQSYAQLV